MATKKLVWVLFGILVISAWFLGSVIQVGAETLKLQISAVITKGEVFPLEKIEGSVLVHQVRAGVFILENGELGSVKYAGTTYSAGPGKGGSFSGYAEYIFGDGSTIVGSQQGTFWGDPEGKLFGFQKASGELLTGSGRFKGIKGTLTYDGKILKPVKGETIAPKVYNAYTLKYTLSP